MREKIIKHVTDAMKMKGVSLDWDLYEAVYERQISLLEKIVEHRGEHELIKVAKYSIGHDSTSMLPSQRGFGEFISNWSTANQRQSKKDFK